MMHGKKGRRVMLFAVVAIAAAGLLGVIVMNLWNWLVPAVFGGSVITFWQSMGMLVLSRILFGGFFKGHCHGRGDRLRIIDRWEKMTPEEREKFRQGMRRGCGVRGPEPGETRS